MRGDVMFDRPTVKDKRGSRKRPGCGPAGRMKKCGES
jgi:hypothetical protein